MKSNNFLIALALCLGLSSTASFCADKRAQNSRIVDPNAFFKSLPGPSFPTTTSSKKPASTWRDWFSLSAWQKSAQKASQALHARAASALSGTLELTNAIKEGVRMKDVSYTMLGGAVAALWALNYNKETILNIVGSVYDNIAAPSIKLIGSGVVGGVKLVGSGAVGGAKLIGSGVVGGAKLVGSGAQYVATTPPLAIPTALAAGAFIVNEMDKANDARKKAEKGKRSSKEEESTEGREEI